LLAVMIVVIIADSRRGSALQTHRGGVELTPLRISRRLPVRPQCLVDTDALTGGRVDVDHAGAQSTKYLTIYRKIIVSLS